MNNYQEALDYIKSCTVAIGIARSNDTTPVKLFGSGFLITPWGSVLSAWHVLEKCFIECKSLNEKDNQIGPVAFHVTQGREVGQVMTIPLYMAAPVGFKPPEGYNGPKTLDLGSAIPHVETKLPALPYLRISKSEKVELYSDIVMCGYPTVSKSLNLTPTDKKGLRYSPIMQFGKISCLMPHDKRPIPYGIQTDIMGNGGSSGSPIVLLSSQEVIGIAQEVLESDAIGDFTGSFTKKETAHIDTIEGKLDGQANIGLVYGINLQPFQEMLEKQIDNRDGLFQEFSIQTINTTGVKKTMEQSMEQY
jgi:hypothetical protein